MIDINGKPSNFNISELTKISDLIEFDGPLLSHFKNSKGENFLFLWVDVDETYNRWIIFKVKESEIKEYLIKPNHYLNSIKNKTIYCVDIDNDIKYHNIKEIDFNEYLKNYARKIR